MNNRDEIYTENILHGDRLLYRRFHHGHLSEDASFEIEPQEFDGVWLFTSIGSFPEIVPANGPDDRLTVSYTKED